MNKKKRNKKWLGLLSCFAVACVGLGVNATINPTEVKTASALTYTTAKYLTYGSTNNGSSTSSGCPSNFKIYMYGSSTSGESTMYQDELTNWSYYYIYIDAIKVSDHRSFRLLRNGYEYATPSISGDSDRVLYEGSLPDGEYELEYTCRYAKNIFYDYTYYTYTYRFEVDKTAPSYTLKAGGSTISSGSYTNKQIVYTVSDKNPWSIRYKRPSASSYSYSYNESYTVAATDSNNGWWYFYGMDYLDQTNSTVSVYLDTVLPVGTIKTSGGTTLSSGSYTNQSIKYSATDTGGVSYLQYKKPGATSWATYTANTVVSGAGWHYFRAVDKAGNTSAESSVYYDSTAPTGTLYGGDTTKTSGSYTNAASVRYVASDGESGISACYVKMPGTSYYTSYTSGSQLTAEGTYEFYSVNKAGVQSAVVKITRDGTAPTGTLYAGSSTIPSGSSTNAANISFTATDKIGLSSVYVKKPNASSYESYTNGTKFTAEGTYSFYAVDLSQNRSATYTVTVDRNIPSAQLYVDENPIANGSYTNGDHIKFESDQTCFVMLPNTDSFVAYTSGTEYYKPGKYVFYSQSAAGTSSGLYTLIVDRIVKPLTFTNVTDGVTYGDVQISWEEQDPNVYAPVEVITINGKSFTFGDTIHTIDGATYEIFSRDAAGNEWTSSFVSHKDNIITETLSKQYYETFDTEGKYYAFPTYDKALAFAIAYENSFVKTGEWNSGTWDTGLAMDSKDSVNAVNGTYYIYKKEGSAGENVAYFTLDRLNEVIEGYAEQNIKSYYYWEKTPADKVAGESLNHYAGENKIVANSIVLGNDIACTLDGEVFVGNVIETAGTHTLKISDDWNNSYEYTVVIVREVPTIQYALGENTVNTAEYHRAYHFKDQVRISIEDTDELAMFTVYDEHGELMGYYHLGDICTVTESGTYTVKAVNHFGTTDVFKMIISRNAPTVELKENVEGKKLDLTITPSVDKESTIQTLEIYESLDGGETWILLEKDDYGNPIAVDKLTYSFRTSAMYRVVVTDEFRTGIDAITTEITYEQQIPEGELIGVEDGGYTNGDVKFHWTDDALVVLLHDGVEMEYQSGQTISDEGHYELVFENHDGYQTVYTFVIDDTAPEVEITGNVHGHSANEDVQLKWTEEGLTATLEVNGEMVGEYVSGMVLTDSATYKITLTDKAQNSTVTEFTIDKFVDFEINVNENGLANSVVVTANEDVAVQVMKDGVEMEYALGDALNDPAKYTVTLTDLLGNEATVTFTIVQPLVQEFVYNFDDTPNFEKVLVNGEDKRLNYGTLEVFEDGNYEIGVVVGGKTYNFTVTVDSTAPALTLKGVENGGQTKEGVTLLDLSEKATMKVYLNDTEIEYNLGDELTELGKYKVVLTDECGNVAEYEFEILYKMNGGTIALIVIGVLVILGIILAIILGKKAAYKKKETDEIEDEDEEDFEDENGDEQDENDLENEGEETP